MPRIPSKFGLLTGDNSSQQLLATSSTSIRHESKRCESPITFAIRSIFLSLIMKLVWSILIIVTPVHCNYLTEQITGCSSKCAVTTDKDLTCFNTTLEYFTTTLMGIMRNYVASQLNLAERSPNRVRLSKEQMVTSTLAVMRQVRPLNIEDEEGLLSVEQARPIVEALVDNVLLNTPGMYNTSCPEGCERSESPWIWLFLVSALANVLLIIMTIAFMMHSYFKAKRMLRETGVPSVSKEIKQH